MLSKPRFSRPLLLAMLLVSGCGEAQLQDPVAGSTTPPASALAATCEGEWEAPGVSCRFRLEGSSITISGEAHSTTPTVDARVAVRVELPDGTVEWDCQGETETSPPGDSTPKPGDSFSFCDDDYDVPAGLVGSEATCRVEGQPSGRFSCSAIS